MSVKGSDLIPPHSEAKHEILKRYLDAWTQIFAHSSKFDKVLYVDGFAGKGKYENQTKEGSPYKIIRSCLDAVSKIRVKNQKIEFLIVLNDIKKDFFYELQTNLNNDFGNNSDISIGINGFIDDSKPIKVLISNDDFKELSKELLELEQRVPSLIFIDPYGFNELFLEDLSGFMNSQSSELIITFDSGHLGRFFLTHPSKKIQKKMIEIFGENFKEKLQNLILPSNSNNFLKVIKIFEEALKESIKYVRSFRMIGYKNDVKYDLVFCTNSFTGLKRMKEAMWKESPDGSYYFADNQSQATMLFNSPNYARLEQLILSQFSGKKNIRIEEIENFVVIETEFRETHIKRQILKPLEEQNKIMVVRSKRKRKGSFPEGTLIDFL